MAVLLNWSVLASHVMPAKQLDQLDLLLDCVIAPALLCEVVLDVGQVRLHPLACARRKAAQ